MKKNDLKKLALMGLSGGILILNPAIAKAATAVNSPKPSHKSIADAADDKKKTDTDKKKADVDYNEGNVGYHLYSEEELLLELDASGTKLYQSLTPEGKALALQVASARCDHTNACKGLNACKTDKNECAGKGGCKGMGKCALADKNLAVKLAAKKMAEKRNQVNNNNY